MEKKTISIIGGGPRGLSALESICASLSIEKNSAFPTIFLFEKEAYLGAGPVYALDQPNTNWLNVSERGLTIPERREIYNNNFSIPPFASYQDWVGYEKISENTSEPDKFPLRSTLGSYLNERYHSIANVLTNLGLLQVIKAEVISLEWANGQFKIGLGDSREFHAQEAVLTVGHQPTKHSEQIGNWIRYSENNPTAKLMVNPYPVQRLSESDTSLDTTVIGIRGFGLAMIDVMRFFTSGSGGEFRIVDEATQELKYIRGGNEPLKIVPFSLDGLPMAPKPINAVIDEWFFPTDIEKENLKLSIGEISRKGTAADKLFLINAMVPIINRVFKALGSKAYTQNFEDATLNEVIVLWLQDEGYEQQLIMPKNLNVEEMLERFVGMATGTKLISLDFCIGHVWRHCQPTLYKALSFSNLDNEVMASIIKLDERLKRYSYGPPVASLQQLLALVRDDLVTLDFVDNPNIRTEDDGWEFSTSKKTIVVDFMINSVLDAPKLMDVDSPLLRNLLEDDMIAPIHDDLGIETYKNGGVRLAESREEIPLAVLGRLAKGTLLGVDAILECFGSRSTIWANGVVQRFKN